MRKATSVEISLFCFSGISQWAGRRARVLHKNKHEKQHTTHARWQLELDEASWKFFAGDFHIFHRFSTSLILQTCAMCEKNKLEVNINRSAINLRMKPTFSSLSRSVSQRQNLEFLHLTSSDLCIRFMLVELFFFLHCARLELSSTAARIRFIALRELRKRAEEETEWIGCEEKTINPKQIRRQCQLFLCAPRREDV